MKRITQNPNHLMQYNVESLTIFFVCLLKEISRQINTLYVDVLSVCPNPHFIYQLHYFLKHCLNLLERSEVYSLMHLCSSII